jgi:hypothetical protein
MDGGYVTTSPLGERFLPHDIATPLPEHLVGRFDLAVCLEVAEHLPPERAESFIRELCDLAPVVLFSAAIPGQGGTGHCFPGDTVVSGPAARRSFARRYQGPIVEMRFASGQLLSATPNHPILTAKGWVTAGLLHEGDYVVRCTDSERITAVVPGDYQVPSPLHEVAASVGVSAHMNFRRMPVTAEDFHGDGVGSKVAVVRADGELRNRGQASLFQPVSEPPLQGAGVSSVSLPGESASVEGFLAPSRSLHAGNEGRGDVLSTFGAPSFGREPIHLSPPPDVYSGRGESITHPVPGYAELIGECGGRDSGFVELDQVVDIRTRIVDHEVYNLSTEPGWYLANGVIVHNCNEQWPDYWVGLFEANGFTVSGALRWDIWEDDRVENWYRANLLVAARDPGSLPEIFQTPLAPVWPVVHPVLYNARRH